MPLRNWPSVFNTDMSQSIDRYLKNSPLRLGLTEIAIAVRKSDPVIRTEISTSDFEAMNQKSKIQYLKLFLLESYIRDCNVTDLTVNRIPWNKVSVQGWPEGVPRKSNQTKADYDRIYRAYTEGNIKFMTK